ncbi:MAG: hypothetical protein AAGK09_06030 [Planctomycetota bacterium]
MPDGSELLRLLEPAVRPAGPAAPSKPDAATTFEGKSFDQLLADAAQRGPEPTAGRATDLPTDTASLADAATTADRSAAGPPGLGHIENPSLARLLAQRPDTPLATNDPR